MLFHTLLSSFFFLLSSSSSLVIYKRRKTRIRTTGGKKEEEEDGALKMAGALYKSNMVKQYHHHHHHHHEHQQYPYPYTLNDAHHTSSQPGRSFFRREAFLFPPKTSYSLTTTITKRPSPSRRQMRVSSALGGLLGGIFKGGSDTGESTRQQYASHVSAVNRFDAEVSALSDDQLRQKTHLFQQRAQQGESLDSILPVKFSFFLFLLFSLYPTF